MARDRRLLWTAPWLLAILAIPLLFYVGGRATGAISLVGYQWGQTTQSGILGSEQAIDLSWSAWLEPGEALQARFDVQANYGSLRLAVHPTTYPWHGAQTAWAFVAGKRSGTVLFVAQEPRYFRFKPSGAASHGRNCVDKSVVGSIIPRRGCPTYDVEYGVTWTRLTVKEAEAAAGPRILLPRHNQPPSVLALNDCGSQVVCGM